MNTTAPIFKEVRKRTQETWTQNYHEGLDMRLDRNMLTQNMLTQNMFTQNMLTQNILAHS